MYLPSWWGVQITVNSFFWCWTWTIKRFRTLLFALEQLKNLQEALRRFLFNEGWRENQKTFHRFSWPLTVRHADWLKWSKQSKAELLHLLSLSRGTFLRPLTSADTLAASIHTSNACRNKHLYQNIPVAFACTPQSKHKHNFCFPGYRLGTAYLIYTLCKRCTE